LKLFDLAGLDTAGVGSGCACRGLGAHRGKMVLLDGYYRGDPHPGNFFVEPGGRIGIVDFGRVGRIDDNLHSALSRLLIALIEKMPTA